MRRDAAMLMMFTLLAGLFLLREARLAPLKNVDAFFVDWLEDNTPLKKDEAAPLLLVEINDSSLGESESGAPGEKHRWPWPPLDYALFLQAISAFEPPVVAIEPVLSWDTISNESPEKRLEHQQYSRLLHNALLRAPKALLGAQLGYVDDPTQPQAQQPVPTIRHVTGDRSQIAEYTAVEGLPDEDFRLSPVLGFTNLPKNQTVRRVPMVFRYRGEVVPSFVLQGLMLWYQLTPDDIEVVPGSHITLGPRAKIPIAADGTMQIDLRVPYYRIGYDDLILLVQQAQSQGTAAPDPRVAEFQHKFALLARTDKEARNVRLATAEFGAPAEVFAAAMAMVQNRHFVLQLPAAADFGFVLMAMGTGPILLGMSRKRIAGFLVISISGYLLFSLWLFAMSTVALPLLLPIGVLLFASLFAFLVR